MKFIFSSDKKAGFIYNIDAKEHKNEIFANLLKNYEIENFLYCKQIHSDTIFVDSCGEGDGIIITDKKNCGLVFTADCYSVAIYDEKLPLAGIFHSGWRGTLQNITGKGCSILKELGAKNLKAVIFPGIESCCFEIGEELVKEFALAEISVYNKENRFFADLLSAIISQLHKHNIQTIENLSECTYCSEQYFSYRKTKTSKRHLSYITV